jgi:hypothetical protein
MKMSLRPNSLYLRHNFLLPLPGMVSAVLYSIGILNGQFKENLYGEKNYA